MILARSATVAPRKEPPMEGSYLTAVEQSKTSVPPARMPAELKKLSVTPHSVERSATSSQRLVS